MKSEAPIPYIWETSIPQSWVRLKGREHFKPAESLLPASNPIDFLRRTQQCVSAVLQPPLNHTPVFAHPRLSDRSQSDFSTRKRTMNLREIDLDGIGTGHHQVRGSLPEPRTIKLRFSSTVKQELRTHILSKISSPRLLVVDRRKIPSLSPSNQTVEQFLKRFETARKQLRPTTSRKGFLPLKLSASVPKLHPKKHQEQDVFLRL